MSYDPENHANTNRRDHNDIREFIHSELKHLQQPDKTWLQKYGMFSSVTLALTVYAVSFLTGYTTLSNQVEANTSDLASKSNETHMMLEFENRDNQLDNLREQIREDKDSNEVQFNKLDSKLDRNQQLMLDIYKEVSKPTRSP